MIQKQVLMFLLIGILNTLFGYSVFSFFIYIGMHYIAAAFLSTCVGVLFSFKTMGQFVFNNANNKIIFKFAFLYLILFFFNIMILKGMQFFCSNMYVNGLIAITTLACISFIMNKYFVFRNPV